MTATIVAPARTPNRWIPVIAGIAVQLCLGTAYIWGVFQPEVTKLFGWPQATAALTFSILLGVLTFGSTIGGMIQDKFGPRMVIIGGGLILGAGFILATFSTAGAPWWMWMTYGALGGFGMGTTYTTIIACCQKWFPDRRGFITGIIVAALGFGGLVFTPLAQFLINTRGVLETFTWLGLLFIVVCTVCAFFISNPPAGYVPAGWTPPVPKVGAHITRDFAPGEVVRTPQFYLVTIALMLACAAGLMVIPFAKKLVIDLKDAELLKVATLAVMVISAFNSFGRLFWGAMSDKLGRKNTLLVLTLMACVTIPFLAVVQGYPIFVLIAVVAFSYGGFLGTFPALTADYWGVKNMGMNYGMVLLGFGVGAVASSFVAGFLRDRTGNFKLAFMIAAAAAFVAFLLVLFLKPPAAKVADADKVPELATAK